MNCINKLRKEKKKKGPESSTYIELRVRMTFRARNIPDVHYEAAAVTDSSKSPPSHFFFPITTVNPIEFLSTSLDNIQPKNIQLH